MQGSFSSLALSCRFAHDNAMVSNATSAFEFEAQSRDPQDDAACLSLPPQPLPHFSAAFMRDLHALFLRHPNDGRFLALMTGRVRNVDVGVLDFTSKVCNVTKDYLKRVLEDDRTEIFPEPSEQV